jgi:uncharacterized protein YacL (UPF0231 family)
MWDWTLFFPGLVATVIGVALGIPLGLWVNRQASEFQRRQEEKRASQRKLAVLEALQEEVRHNLELLNQLEGEIKSNQVPFYTLDTDTWGFLGGELAQIVSPETVLTRTSRLYFEFDHMKRKMDALFELFANPLMGASSVWKQRYSALSGSILVHLPPTKQLCDEVLELLKDEIQNTKTSGNG